MKFLKHVETGFYVVATLVFVGAGVYGLWLIFPRTIPSLSVDDLLVTVLFVAVMVGVILLGALAGSDGDE